MTQLSTFECHAFHEKLTGGRSRGELIITESGFRFTIGVDQIGDQLTLPFEGAEISLGGASDRLVFINHPNFSEWSFYTNDRNILKHEALLAQPTLLDKVRAKKKKHRLNGGVIAALLLVVLAVPLLLILKMDWVSKFAAKQIPVAWEEKIGESSLAQFTVNQRTMPEEGVNALLEPLVRTLESLAINNQYQFRYSIVEQSVANAFALPGGFVVIHSGLILKADSAEEFLGVIAHEMAHVNQQHGVRNVIGSAGIYLIASILIGDANGVIATLAATAPFLINQSYSRKFEKEADLLGHETLVSANINPAGLASFFEKLKAQEEEMLAKMGDDERAKDIQDVMSFLSTHPASEDRIQYLRSLPQEANAQYLNLTNEFESLKLAVQQFVSTSSPTSPPGESE